MTTTSNHKTHSSIAIIGGGIAGLTTAIALQKIGFQPFVFEAAPQIKALGAGLLLAANAMKGFERIGIADIIIPAGQQLSQFAILDQQGKSISEADSKALSERYGLHNFAIHRADLHQVLMTELKDIALKTGKKATHFIQEADTVTVYFEDGSQHSTEYMIVADGIHSAIRQQLVPESTPRYAGYTCWRAVVDNPGLTLNAATETWGAAGRMGIVPLANNKIYWFLCINAPQGDLTMKAYKTVDLAARFKDYHAPIPQLLQATRNEQLIWSDIIDLKPIQKYAFGRVLLLGDAAHATTPNMGQGACQAIEDAAVLLDECEKMSDDFTQVFQNFERRRLHRTHTIVNRSWSIGKVAQWTNPFLIGLRNRAIRLIPPSVNERQMAFLYQTDF